MVSWEERSPKQYITLVMYSNAKASISKQSSFVDIFIGSYVIKEATMEPIQSMVEDAIIHSKGRGTQNAVTAKA
jgi:hypothetical protein